MSFSFGTPTTGIGAGTPQQAGFNFGAPKPTGTPTLTGLGGNTSAASTGFGFGTTTPASAPPASAPNTGFGFNSPAGTTTAATTSFGFGTQQVTAAAPAPAPAFGLAPAAAPASTAAPGFNFNTPATATSTPAAVPSLFGATAQPAASAAAPAGLTSSFSFGKPTASAAPLNLNTTATTSTGLGGFGAQGGALFGKPGLAPTTAIQPVTIPTTAPPPFVGLGGVDVNTSSQPKRGDSKQDNVKVKETQVPEQITRTVDSFKAYMKQQKTLSSDIGRSSISKLSNVTAEIGALQQSLQEIANYAEANYNQIKLLRKDTSMAIHSAEMAQRTHDTPPGLQFENTAPFVYFQTMVQKYETDLINFRAQIALTENHMKSITNPHAVSPEDLKRGLHHINESFISLAGRLHEIHQRVEQQKEQFLNLRKYRLRDSTNVFAQLESTEASKANSMKISSGPTPFSNISGMSMSFSMGASGANGNNQTGKS